MGNKRLEEYLKIVVEMETSCYLQKKIESTIKNQISLLGHKNNYIKPNIVRPDKARENQQNSMILFPVLAIIGGATTYWSWTTDLEIRGFFLSMVMLLILLAGVSLCVMGIRGTFNVLKNDCVDEAEKLWGTYNQNINEDMKRIEKELVIKKYLEDVLKKISDKRKETELRLNKMYGCNIIFPKYRNFTMVSMLYEYICAGRCDSLEGHDGAYNILEVELRLDRIIVEIDLVNQKLDQIKSNQFILYSAIQDINARFSEMNRGVIAIMASLNEIHNSVDNIDEHIAAMQKKSEIEAYLMQQTYKEVSYMNRMKYYSGEYDKEFFDYSSL